MANDYEDGVWRTVGGRRIFIRDGEDLSSAMKRSGKFGKKKQSEIAKEEKEKWQKQLEHDKAIANDKSQSKEMREFAKRQAEGSQKEVERYQKYEEKFTQKELDDVWKKEDATEVYDTLSEREKTKLAQAHDDANNFNNQSAKEYIKKMDNEAAKRFLEKNAKEKEQLREKLKSEQRDIKVNGPDTDTIIEDFEDKVVSQHDDTMSQDEKKRAIDNYVQNYKAQGEPMKNVSAQDVKEVLYDNYRIKDVTSSDDQVMSREEYQKMMMKLPNRSDYERTNYEDYVQATKDVGAKEVNKSLREQLSDKKVSSVSKNQAYKSAYADYKKKHPNTNLSLEEFIKYSEGK